MRFLSLVLVSCCALCAATIPVHMDGPPKHIITPPDGSRTIPFSIPMPQFDGSLGTLQSATFYVNLSTEIHYSIYDIGVLPGLSFSEPFSVSWKGPYFDITENHLISGITSGTNDSGFGNRPIRIAGSGQQAVIVLTGDDLAPFIGNGLANISWERTLTWPRNRIPVSDSNGDESTIGLALEWTSDQLIATGEYTYTVAPEPRLIGMTLALLIGVAVKSCARA